MGQFVAFEEGIEVNGQTIFSIVDAMAVRFMTEKIFKEVGLPPTSEIEGNPHGWYPQQRWLDAFRRIAEKIGHASLFAIGKKIPENAEFPPDIDSVEKALASIDVAYHMNHRNSSGEVLFDPSTGKMLEGIGHYQYEKVGENKAVLTCQNPYPCDFDRGIIKAMARRFEKNSRVDHMEGRCRNAGADLCRYEVEW